jgi:threonine synthase
MTYLQALAGPDGRFDPDAAINNPWTDGRLLTCDYDLDRLRAEVPRDAISAGPPTLWRYAPLLPVRDVANAVTLAEGFTPILLAPRLGAALGCKRLLVKDEGRNPSGSFKDRGAAVAISRLRELGVTRVVHNSSGNAGGSWALYAARAGVGCVNVMPDDVLPASLAQSLLAGADTVLVEGPWNAAGRMAREAAAAQGWFFVGTLAEPWRLEGKKTMGLEIAEQLGWRLPEVVVYPAGGGLGAIAIYKGFEELQRLGWIAPGPLPKLVISQYAGCAPIVRAFEEGTERARPWAEIDTPRGGLKSPSPLGDRAVLDLLRRTGGTAIAVSGEDAIAAAEQATRLEGIFPCPESGTALVALRDAIRRGVLRGDEETVVVSTASGLKSVPNFALPDAARIASGAALPAYP